MVAASSGRVYGNEKTNLHLLGSATTSFHQYKGMQNPPNFKITFLHNSVTCSRFELQVKKSGLFLNIFYLEFYNY